MLIVAVFWTSLRIHGAFAATLTTLWLIASPGFLELSSSVMQEIPALAPAVAALAVLLVGPQTRWFWPEILGGILFAAALQKKFIGIIYLPLILLILWLRHRDGDSALTLPSPLLRRGEPVAEDPERGLSIVSQLVPPGWLRSLVLFGASLALSFVAILVLTGQTGPYLLQIGQTWEAHFAAAKSFEYGSPADHPFDWSVLLKNWDATLPALVGVIFLLREGFPAKAACGRLKMTLDSSSLCLRGLRIVPVAWLALTLGVLGTHKPWWTYYYVHTAVPLCWCAAVGIAGLWQWICQRRSAASGILLTLFCLAAAAWMGGRIYLQAASIRRSPQIHSSLVLSEVERLKPFSKFIYSEEPVLSFYAGIPLPPGLGVISLKRFWSGDLTNARLAQELWDVKPGILLLKNTPQERPFHDLISKEYRLVYYDADYRLYGRKAAVTAANQPRPIP